ncbi:hypothetical protein C5N92_10405 [Glaesserella australis]|uniref:Uncharacterized protein n=1 Tax=Glaesserella australis TaxID=2094024 RepID=A0A328C0N5_9PAST|nr:hypothetical protein C5N92_10405 [Glaesserella australis]
MVPFAPSKPILPFCPSLPPIVSLLFKANVTLFFSFVITILPSLFAKSTVAFGATFVLFLPSLIVKFQPADAVLFTASNWFLFTASVPLTPGATFLIVLLLLFSPSLVILTVPLVPPVIDTPSLLIVVLPVVTVVKFGVMLVAILIFLPV